MATRITINSPDQKKNKPQNQSNEAGSPGPAAVDSSLDPANPTAPLSSQGGNGGELETAASGDVAELIQQLEEKNAEIQRLQDREKTASDQLLRAVADLENVRRRGRQEREEAVQYGTQQLLADLLPIIDNFERALSSPNISTEALMEGVQLTLKQFQETLSKHGVEGVPGVGEPFDAQHHEAIMQGEPTDAYPAGTVMDEIRRGYRLRGRLLRPSLVKVAQD